MAVFPQIAQELAQTGINLEITSAAGYFPQIVEELIRAVVEGGGHVTVDANGYFPDTLKRFAQIGGKNLTIRL